MTIKSTLIVLGGLQVYGWFSWKKGHRPKDKRIKSEHYYGFRQIEGFIGTKLNNYLPLSVAYILLLSSQGGVMSAMYHDKLLLKYNPAVYQKKIDDYKIKKEELHNLHKEACSKYYGGDFFY